VIDLYFGHKTIGALDGENAAQNEREAEDDFWLH
jgi:hypothetical protein